MADMNDQKAGKKAEKPPEPTEPKPPEPRVAEQKVPDKAAGQTPPARRLAELKTAPEERNAAGQQLLNVGEISIWIDTYDDIFSDFDPRPYTQRSLSVDFLDEAKRAAREKADGLVLHILAPAAIRSSQHEGMVRRRLKEHFTKHALEKAAEQKAITRRGLLFCAAGIIFLALATLIAFYGAETLSREFLVVLFEPAGWFAVWSGMDMVFFRPNDLQQETEFYRKMSAAEIRFDSY